MKNTSTFISSIAMLALACGDPPPPPPVEVAPVAALQAHTKEFAREVIEVTKGVHVAVGFGLANSIMIEGTDGLIIVDTMESIEEGRTVLAAFRKISGKPVKAIIYTHNHTDHIFGSAAFAEGATPEVFAHATTNAQIDQVAAVVQPIIRVRSARMFGSHLEGAAMENAGIGPELSLDEHSTLQVVRPTRTFEDRLEVTVAGVELHLVHAPGETDDQIFVWLPKHKVLLPGDNLYRTFPNLYTIRGTPYRDVRKWVASLDMMRALSPEFLVPSHTRPLSGADHIATVVRDYRDGIQFVHDQTVRWMNRGLTPDEIVERVQLPPHLRKSPFLVEFYGTVRWSVRSIFDGYLGWFDGNPTTLDPLAPRAHAERMAALAGGTDALSAAAKKALDAGDAQWALELSDALRALKPDDAAAKKLRASALRKLGEVQSNPNSRHYYLTAALEEEGLRAGVRAKPTAAMVHEMPMAAIFAAFSTKLNAEKTLELDEKYNFHFPDTGETYGVHLRRGVAEVQRQAHPNANATLSVDSRVWKEVAAKIRDKADLITAGGASVEGSTIDFMRFMSYFLGEPG